MGATQQKNAQDAVEKFSSEDAARQKSALDFMEKQLKLAEEEMDEKFGKAYNKLAKDRAHAEGALGSAVNGLNDALAKQAALADSRFEKTVADISAARKQAAKQVADLRKEFGTEMALAVAEAKHTEQILVDNIAKVSGEVISMKANQIRVNLKVKEDLVRVEKLSNDRFTKSTKARGKLRMLMDENKQAAAEEVKALSKDLDGKIKKLRALNQANKIEMQKDLTAATTTSAKLAAQNELARAQAGFDSKIVMLTNVVTANAAKAAADDRKLIKEQTKMMEADLNKALNRAIS